MPAEKQACSFNIRADHHTRPATGGMKGIAKLREMNFIANWKPGFKAKSLIKGFEAIIEYYQDIDP